MAAPRSAFRLFQSTARTALRQPIHRQTFARQTLQRSFQTSQRKTQSTVAEGVGNDGQSGFAKLWNSKVGPKTVHFWAPIMKWGLVIAGLSDLYRPPEALSLSQNLALMATGAIWTRWCFIIKPQNIFLATVNFFVFCVAATQVTRIYLYRTSLDDKTLGEEAKQLVGENLEKVKGVVKDSKGTAQQATKT